MRPRPACARVGPCVGMPACARVCASAHACPSACARPPARACLPASCVPACERPREGARGSARTRQSELPPRNSATELTLPPHRLGARALPTRGERTCRCCIDATRSLASGCSPPARRWSQPLRSGQDNQPGDSPGAGASSPVGARPRRTPGEGRSGAWPGSVGSAFRASCMA